MKDSTRKAVIDMSEYNELVKIKYDTPKFIVIHHNWYGGPTIQSDGKLPDELTEVLEKYQLASDDLEKLRNVPEWVRNFFTWIYR